MVFQIIFFRGYSFLFKIEIHQKVNKIDIFEGFINQYEEFFFPKKKKNDKQNS